MSKKYENLARQIVDMVGGDANVDSLHHCQTRLRFHLKDSSLADEKGIAALDDVVQVVEKGGMFQVVIGMQVGEVYEEVEKLLSPKTEGEAPKEKGKEKMSFKKAFDVVTDFISSIFSPIVPALAGAGMVKALLALLSALQLIAPDSQVYILLNMIGDATFAFMPILLGYTTAKKLGCSPILAAVTAGILCHPTWTGLVAAGEPVSFAGIPLYLVRYTGSVIPIVLITLVQCPLEKWLNKVVPGAIRLVVVPMLEFLIMGILGLSILGPLGDYIGTAFTAVFSFLSENVGWLEAMLMGGLYSPLVIFGLHHGLAPLGTMQMSQMGYDGIFGPGVLCANIGQGVACLVTGLMAKSSKTKQIGISAGITGLMGTTEPAIYGINLPEKYPLFAGMIGGAAGGLYAGLMHVHRYATGSSGLPAVVMYIGEGSMSGLYNILIALVIDVTVAAIATVIFHSWFTRKNRAAAAEKTGSQLIADTPEAICEGQVLAAADIPDPTFSAEVMGKTIGIIPAEDEVRAPAAGKVAFVSGTKHAIGLNLDNGQEILIHIGIDTVYMDGKGFEVLVEPEQRVEPGQLLIRFSRKAIKDAGYSDIINVILTNTANYENVTSATTGSEPLFSC